MYKSAIAIHEHLCEKTPQLYQINLARDYYWLGTLMAVNIKFHDAISMMEHSVKIFKDLKIEQADSLLFIHGLSLLVSLHSYYKNYAKACVYNEELLPLLKVCFEADAEKWRSEYSGSLINQAFYSNLLGKFQEGEQYSLEALKIDSTKHITYTNLAPAMLFLGKTEEAEKLYRQYKVEFKDSMLDDIAEFERLGIIPEGRKSDVERIKVILKE